MFTLQKSYTFCAGHTLTRHDRMCQFPHGHTYTLTVILRTEELIASGPKTNMVTDFYDISAVVKPMITQYFDHKWLNETLQSESPTIEFAARWVYNYLHPRLSHLHAISLGESPTSSVTYCPSS
ncbi:MAG: 6-carboxytetrahydropterin synthase [Chlamydiia bacterium]|nr:6-carboxytetrahydropterin synthase [Chlamydiia bacterium]